jgi:hypothetical protein
MRSSADRRRDGTNDLLPQAGTGCAAKRRRDGTNDLLPQAATGLAAKRRRDGTCDGGVNWHRCARSTRRDPQCSQPQYRGTRRRHRPSAGACQG